MKMYGRQARIPFNLTEKVAVRVVFALLFWDLLFVAAYLVTTLPELRGLGGGLRFACLDLNVEGNIPTNYSILKLYLISIVCGLMVFSYKGKAPAFWKISFVVLFIIGLDESAQLHELWAGVIAPRIFGTKHLYGNQFTILPYLCLLGLVYGSSLTLFPRNSKTVFVMLVLSGCFMILSQGMEWTLRPVIDLMLGVIESSEGLLSGIPQETLILAWEEGLEMIGFSLLCGGIALGVAVTQKKEIEAVSSAIDSEAMRSN
jgi:hypothetical protein